MFLKWEERLFYLCRILWSPPIGFCRHSDMTFLCQWISAMHHPLALNRLSSPGRTFFARANYGLQKHSPWNSTSCQGDICRLGDIPETLLPALATFVARTILLLLFLCFFLWFLSCLFFPCTIGLSKIQGV